MVPTHQVWHHGAIYWRWWHACTGDCGMHVLAVSWGIASSHQSPPMPPRVTPGHWPVLSPRRPACEALPPASSHAARTQRTLLHTWLYAAYPHMAPLFPSYSHITNQPHIQLVGHICCSRCVIACACFRKLCTVVHGCCAQSPRCNGMCPRYRPMDIDTTWMSNAPTFSCKIPHFATIVMSEFHSPHC